MPGDRASAISRNGCYGIWIGTAASVRLDAGELHHFGPLLGFAGEETAEVGGWAGQHRSTHVGQPRLRLGVGEDCIISMLSRPMTSGGVFLGAMMPKNALASYPGTNWSTVGMSGSASERAVVVTASARSLPARMCSTDDGRLSNIRCTCPARRSVSAGPAPR